MEKYGMVLAGGGAKGAYQVGVFKALREYGILSTCEYKQVKSRQEEQYVTTSNTECDIEIAAVSGSSIGGINAFAYATMSQEKIEQLWSEFSFDDFLNADDDWTDGISDRSGLLRILDECVSSDKLKDTIPVFNTICENEQKPEYKLLNNKSDDMIKKIILATSALPVIYSKVDIEGREYMDGGMADNLPIYPLYANGYKNLIVVGLKDTQRLDKNKFKVDKLIEINPSYDLGDTASGTLNFDKKYIAYAMKLGYADAKRALNTYLGIDNGCHTPQFDYDQIMHEMKVQGLQDNLDRNMELLKKYGF